MLIWLLIILLNYYWFFTDSADCPICDEALQNLEDIDDDADAVGVRMIKTDDAEFAQEIGITEFPAIVYYEHGNPHIYDGKIKALIFFSATDFNMHCCPFEIFSMYILW